ncbi:NADPH-dependent FMN reductase [Cumulibacter manganitolerans]|uniref:NADPH-dependent FMN reductase n=1 Tax=Cumulibacter manganitolerans TaxID=1884992 RepID=UPI001296DB03|nr:NAD(P)H-dependent oxidoreductase [Cumulibacter manganitolerans]
MNVLVLVGSLREESTNRRLAETVGSHLPEGVAATVYGSLDALPFYSEDVDGDAAPTTVTEFRAAVSGADALVVVTPEYNGTMSGVIKNAIDWASRPFGAGAIAGKPVAVLAASGSARGAQWAREDAVKVLRIAGAAPLERTFGLGAAHSAFTDAGLANDAIAAELRALLGELHRELVSA